MALSYSFPIFSSREIADFFSQQISPPVRVTDNDIKNIKAPVALRLYASMCEVIMDVDVQDICQPRFDWTSSEHPEVLDTFLQVTALLKCVQWILTHAGAGDFNWMDLKDPKPKRTLKYLSALMNYYMFVSQHAHVYDELKANKDEQEETLAALREANDVLQGQIEVLKTERSDQEPQCRQLTKQEYELDSQLDSLVQQKSELLQKTQDVKSKLTKLIENMDSDNELLSSKKDELTIMDAQIIQSPARMKVDIENMKDKKDKVRARLSEKRERLNEMEAKIREEDIFLREADGALKIVKEVNELLAKEVLLMDDHSDLESRIADVQARCRERNRQVEALDHEIEKGQQKHQRANVNKQLRISSMKAEISARQRSREQVKESAGQKKHQYQSRLKEIHNIRAEGDESLREENAKLEKMEAKYAELLEALDTYHTRLATQYQQTADGLRDFMQKSLDSLNTQ